jgi:DNA-binding NarL/FixJ family response regulator
LDPTLGWSVVRESLYSTGESKKSKNLTETEIKILEFVFQGKTSKQVASDMNLSTETVNRHRKNVLKKLKASNIVDAINIARERGILNKL